MKIEFFTAVPTSEQKLLDSYSVMSLLVSSVAKIAWGNLEHLDKLKLGKTYKITIEELDVPVVETY